MYQWLIFVHVLGVFGFLLAHGTAAAVAFRLRAERDVERVRALLDLSHGVLVIARVSLFVVLVAGIVAGFMGNWWGRYWIWSALGLLVLISIAMNFLASRPFTRVRQLVGAVGPAAHAKDTLQSPSSVSVDQQLAVTLAATHPLLMTVIGGGGFALILWLMMFKPF